MTGVIPKDASQPLPPSWRYWLAQKWPDGERLGLAFGLATNVEDCAALIRGEYVDPARLDQDWLRWARRGQLVRLATPDELRERAA